ncbi:MAG: PqqD family protein [Candidatus Omnitrophota bacterium]|jgi:hypothetical protein
MDGKKMFIKNNDVVTREIEGEVILMPLHSSSKDLNYIYTLNDTASYAWSLMDGKTALSDIKGRIMDRYEVDEAKLDKELGELIKDLRSIKALI